MKKQVKSYGLVLVAILNCQRVVMYLLRPELKTVNPRLEPSVLCFIYLPIGRFMGLTCFIGLV